MTPIEFSAWIRGVNAALNGAMPSKELWAEVVKEAQGIAPAYPFAPALPVAPLTPFVDQIKRSIADRLPMQPAPLDRKYGPFPPNPREYILGGAMAAQGHEARAQAPEQT